MALRSQPRTSRNCGTAASEVWSRVSTAARAPGVPNLYCRPVTRPMAVNAVRPVYSKVTDPAPSGLLARGHVTRGGYAVTGVYLTVFFVHAHIGFLLVFEISGRRLSLSRAEPLDQNRPGG